MMPLGWGSIKKKKSSETPWPCQCYLWNFIQTRPRVCVGDFWLRPIRYDNLFLLASTLFLVFICLAFSFSLRYAYETRICNLHKCIHHFSKKFFIWQKFLLDQKKKYFFAYCRKVLDDSELMMAKESYQACLIYFTWFLLCGHIYACDLAELLHIFRKMANKKKKYPLSLLH